MYRESNELVLRMRKSIMDELDEDRSKEVHVTDLVYGCARKAWFEKTLGYGITDTTSMIVLWTGKKLHETGMVGCEHEVKIEMNLGGVRVVGSIDELCDDGELVVDKKTTRGHPSKPYDHHVMQVLLYALALKKMGRKVPSRGAIVYINVVDGTLKAYEFMITASVLDRVEREASERAKEIWNAMQSGKPPRARPGWLCNYCSYIGQCAKIGV